MNGENQRCVGFCATKMNAKEIKVPEREGEHHKREIQLGLCAKNENK